MLPQKMNLCPIYKHCIRIFKMASNDSAAHTDLFRDWRLSGVLRFRSTSIGQQPKSAVSISDIYEAHFHRAA